MLDIAHIPVYIFYSRNKRLNIGDSSINRDPGDAGCPGDTNLAGNAIVNAAEKLGQLTPNTR